MEGFLSLDEAALQLEFTVTELSQQIDEGRVVAIVRDGSPWLSAGEVSRLKRQSLRATRRASTEDKTLPLTSEGLLLSKSNAFNPDVELQQHYIDLERRNQELETSGQRLKLGLLETEAALKRSRVTRANLENDVLSLQEQLGKVKSRNEALEREVQQLTLELDRKEESYASDLRRLRSKGERMGYSDDREALALGLSADQVENLRREMEEKDRLLAQEYGERGVLRSQLEDRQQKYFELKARYDKEKTEWSETVARAYQNQNQLREQIEELKGRVNPKGWNPFRRDR